MGWTFTEKPQNIRNYLESSLTHENDRCARRVLDIAMRLHVAYAAVEIRDKQSGAIEVLCVVILMKYVAGDTLYNWGCKDMDETWGPCQDDCPKRILDLLTPTTNETSIEWRARCRRNLRKRMPRIGTRVRFDSPIPFTDGSEESEFTVVRYGRRKKRLQGRSGRLFNVSQRIWRDREWVIVV